jgi:hypothetical protein
LYISQKYFKMYIKSGVEMVEIRRKKLATIVSFSKGEQSALAEHDKTIRDIGMIARDIGMAACGRSEDACNIRARLGGDYLVTDCPVDTTGATPIPCPNPQVAVDVANNVASSITIHARETAR